LFHDLWTDPRVMANVGFPHGLRITRDDISRRIAKQGESEFDRLLVVALKATGQALGECMMHPPDEKGIASTDVKLLPAFWGNGYGVEVKRGLLAHLFEHTDCVAVDATPNVENAASIRMQEAVGGVRIGEAVSEFPESMRDFTTPVRHYIYRVERERWRGSAASGPGRGSVADIIRGSIARVVVGAGTVTRYRTPLVSFAAADDPRFAELRTIVGPEHVLPRDLLPRARSVVAYFLPFEPGVPESNARSRTAVSREWALAYTETNSLLARIAQGITEDLAAAGVRAAGAPPTGQFDRRTLLSAWSHKSVAVIAGLGSFGVHHMVITDAGCAGRLGSLVVDVDLPVGVARRTERCIHLREGGCLECVARCPVGALSELRGIDRHACWERCLAAAKEPESFGAHVCGKCATGPCAVLPNVSH
jgi:epoxyqueuosine reductase